MYVDDWSELKTPQRNAQLYRLYNKWFICLQIAPNYCQSGDNPQNEEVRYCALQVTTSLCAVLNSLHHTQACCKLTSHASRRLPKYT